MLDWNYVPLKRGKMGILYPYQESSLLDRRLLLLNDLFEGKKNHQISIVWSPVKEKDFDRQTISNNPIFIIIDIFNICIFLGGLRLDSS